MADATQNDQQFAKAKEVLDGAIEALGPELKAAMGFLKGMSGQLAPGATTVASNTPSAPQTGKDTGIA